MVSLTLSFSALKTEAQKVFNAWILLRDKEEPCIYCGFKSWGKGPFKAEAAHFIAVSVAESLRYHSDNCHKAHRGCNQENDSALYRANLVKRIGEAPVKYLEDHRHDLAKFTRDQIEEVYAKYK